MEKKPIENVTAVITEEQLTIKTTNTATGTVEEAQVSLQAETITTAPADNVMKTRH